MGQGASVIGSIERLPDPLDEESAREWCGDCFEPAEWEKLVGMHEDAPGCGGNGKVPLEAFRSAVDARNFMPSLRAWLESWRVDGSLVPALQALNVEAPADLASLDEEEVSSLGLKPVKARHFNRAMAHAKYLQEVGLAMPMSPLGAKRAGGLKAEERMTASMRVASDHAHHDLERKDTWGLEALDEGEDGAEEKEGRGGNFVEVKSPSRK